MAMKDGNHGVLKFKEFAIVWRRECGKVKKNRGYLTAVSIQFSSILLFTCLYVVSVYVIIIPIIIIVTANDIMLIGRINEKGRSRRSLASHFHLSNVSKM